MATSVYLVQLAFVMFYSPYLEVGEVICFWTCVCLCVCAVGCNARVKHCHTTGTSHLCQYYSVRDV